MQKVKDVFVIQAAAQEGQKAYWRRCGVAFVNRDNSLNVRLDLFPGVDIQIRDRKPRDSSRPRK